MDATLLAAPSSTKNQSGARDPEMHQVRKGNQWYFGMKAHVGVDAETRLVHSVAATAANVADGRVLPELLHGQTEVYGDQVYQGHGETIRRWRTKLKVYPEIREENRIRGKIRSRVEHVFAVMKLRFGFSKVRYRGLAKNLHRIETICALINLYTASKRWTAVPQPHCAEISSSGLLRPQISRRPPPITAYQAQTRQHPTNPDLNQSIPKSVSSIPT